MSMEHAFLKNLFDSYHLVAQNCPNGTTGLFPVIKPEKGAFEKRTGVTANRVLNQCPDA